MVLESKVFRSHPGPMSFITGYPSRAPASRSPGDALRLLSSSSLFPDPRVQLTVNGVKTVDYVEKEEGIERKGIIGLQIHGGPPTEAWYKDITIVELD